MKRTRFWTRLLALGLCAALALAPAALAESAPADQALEAVTALVKERLGLDTSAYSSFQGHQEEDPRTGVRWNLEWSSDSANLSIQADGAGKVYSYHLYDAGESVQRPGGSLDFPKLPEDKSSEALTAARNFVDRALDGAVERCALASASTPSLRQTGLRFAGTVLLHGLPSPISCQVTLRAADLTVTDFWRSDSYAGYLSPLPDPATAVTEAQARTALRTTLTMEARYVLEPDGKTAKVRYLPAAGDDYYVDGATGKLVDLTALYEQLSPSGEFGAMAGGATNDSAAAAPEADKEALTPAEREGAALLAGALDKAALDAAVKAAWPQMGLSGYTLSAAAYSLADRDGDGAETDVLCRLTYTRQTGAVIQTKRVTVDAKTGAVESLRSTRAYESDEAEKVARTTTLDVGAGIAQTAVKTFAGGNADKVALAEREEASKPGQWEHRYTFQHTAGGYFYPGNSYTVGVDATDGTLSRLEGFFDETIALQVPASVVTPDQAADAYLAALTVPYGYVEVPVALDLAGDEVAPLLREQGYTYLTALKPGYALAQPEGKTVDGVYADTGAAVVTPQSKDDGAALTYDDLSGHWAETAAATLGKFGVGLPGGSLAPGQPLTQVDMLALLTSVDGYRFDPAEPGAVDALYRRGYALGLLTPQARQEDKTVTRFELVRCILDAAGYGKVAALGGIFRCDFSDAAALDASTLGYAALAQGLGLVRGGSDGAFAPARTITRGEAVAMLYQYMK